MEKETGYSVAHVANFMLRLILVFCHTRQHGGWSIHLSLMVIISSEWIVVKKLWAFSRRYCFRYITVVVCFFLLFSFLYTTLICLMFRWNPTNSANSGLYVVGFFTWKTASTSFVESWISECGCVCQRVYPCQYNENLLILIIIFDSIQEL